MWSHLKTTVALVAAMILVLVNASSTLATQHDPPWADAMWAHFPETNGLWTQNTMDEAADGLSVSSAPYDAFSTNPSSAHDALSTAYAQSDAVWWMAGHGAAGLIQTYSTGAGYSNIWAGSGVPGASCVSPNDCLSDYGPGSMGDIKLMIFMGCHTGTLTSNNVRLPKKAHDSLEVDSAVGFDDFIGFSAGTSDWWADKFGYYSSPAAGYMSVYDAAWAATNSVAAHNGGDANGYDSLITYGAAGTNVFPAGYGS